MSFEPDQFKEFIANQLYRLGRNAAKPEAVKLLLLTAAHETHLGRWLWQADLKPWEGGACGPFQMEPLTHDDVQHRLVAGRYPWMPMDSFERMIWDLKYAVWMARIYYLQFPEPIPPANEIDELADYYKKYWNTPV